MRCALLALALFSVVSPTFADSKLDRLDRSYPYGAGRVTLDHNAEAIAVLLRTDVEDEWNAISQLAAETASLATPERDDRQGYERLWFLRLERALSVEEYGALIDAISNDPRIRFAAPIFAYDNSIMVPKPELLLAFTREDEATRRTLEEELGLTLLRALPGTETTYHYRTRHAARDLLRLSCELIDRREILRVEPNFITKLERLSAPNDPLFNTQWAHENTGQTGGTVGADMKSVSAWDVTTGSSSIVIAIIDEGVDMDHEDLAASIVGGHDSTDQPWPEGVEGNALPDNGHGTSCAGIAAAIGNNGIGIAGVSQNAGILAVRIGYADHWTEDAWIIDAITWSTDNGADVLSNSWGGGAPSSAEQNAMQYAKTTGRGGLGCPILFASGNDNALVDYPGKYPETMAIGASSPCDERKNPASCDGETWWGSNYGPELTLVTPGVLIQATDIMGADGYASGNYVADFNGTSSACPQAAGAAALLLSVLPGLTADEVQTYLEQSCDDEVGPPGEDTPGWDQYMGHGRLNLTTLMSFAGAPALPGSLTCTDVSADAQLTWSNPQSYDQIIVQRDGVDIAAISGTATSYVDLAPSIGTRTYGVRGVVGSLDGPSAMCSVFISGGATDLVWMPADAAGTIDGGQGLLDALAANGRNAVLVDDLTVVSDLNDFDRIWVNLGIFPDNHVLTAGNATLLETYLTDGIGGSALYLEGGDTWAYDTATTLHAFFEISGVADGTGDYSVAVGTGASSCDLTGIDLAYGGENAWIDRLAPAGAAWTIQQNDTPSYDSAVFNDASTFRTIGASHEFAGLVDGASTRADLMASYLDCLGAGTVPNPVTGLTGGESGNDVLVTWSNGDVYSTIDVMRNGVMLATISGTATSYADVAPPGGSHTYTVIGYDVNTSSNATNCNTTVTPDSPTGLNCSVTPTQVDLSWANAESYSSIEVRRAGVVLATLAGSATS
ncbi:MAG: S8 family serine peptidase, partial [Planctomycetota bacterium]